MEGKIKYKVEQLTRAVFDFEQSLKIDLLTLDSVVSDAVKSGHIQKFEFTVELLWKTMKVFLLEVHGFDEKSPKTVIKKFYSLGYLSDEEYEDLMDFMDDRNLLSHTYSKEQFEEIYKRIVSTGSLFKKILLSLSQGDVPSTK